MALVQSLLIGEASRQKGEHFTMEQAILTALMAQTQELMNSLASLRSLPAFPHVDSSEECSETQTAIKKARRPSMQLRTSTLSSDRTPQAAKRTPKRESRPATTKASNKAQRTISPVTALDLLDKLLDIDVQGRIRESSTQCLATAQTRSARCRIAVRAQNKQLIITSLDTLSELKVGSDPTRCAEKLASFVDLTFCGRHHRSQAHASIDDWKKKNSMAKDSATSQTASKDTRASSNPVKSVEPSASDKELPLVRTQRKKKAKNEIDWERSTSPRQHGVLPPRTFRYDLRRSPRNMKRYQQEGCRFCHRGPPPTLPVGLHIRITMNKPLGVKALRSGFLYVYRHVGEKDFFKIGYSTVGAQQRIKRWEKQCGHETEVVYPSNDAEGFRIGNVYRLEQLIHAELRDYRYREEGCEGCGKNHVEWFKVGEEHIRAVIEKWVDWIQEKPYEEKNDIWRLEKQQKREVGVMCTPLKASVGELDADWESQVPVRRSTLIRS